MSRQYYFQTFILNNQNLIDKDINSITYINLLIFINQWKLYFRFRIPTTPL